LALSSSWFPRLLLPRQRGDYRKFRQRKSRRRVVAVSFSPSSNVPTASWRGQRSSSSFCLVRSGDCPNSARRRRILWNRRRSRPPDFAEWSSSTALLHHSARASFRKSWGALWSMAGVVSRFVCAPHLLERNCRSRVRTYGCTDRRRDGNPPFPLQSTERRSVLPLTYYSM
jgi:hypothetical protein